MLVCDPRDIRYLTGVEEGISRLIVTSDATIAVTRHLFIEELRELLPDCELLLPVPRSTVSPDLAEFVIAQIERLGLPGLRVDPGRMTAADYLALNEAAARSGRSLESSPGLVQRLRSIKEPGELSLIRRCVEISETALRELIAGGADALLERSERDLAIELEARMVELGADRQGFPGTGLIVASGPNAAHAHHRPGTRRIRAGEPLLIDWGAELQGYRSDMTRTFFPGHIAEFGQRVYPIVEDALLKATAQLRPGEVMSEVDRVARETVQQAGLSEFHYGVGHGVGLEIHEQPWIRLDSDERFFEGMVTTIEPGVYQPGIGGIRIENLHHLTARSAESLGTLPTGLDAMLVP